MNKKIKFITPILCGVLLSSSLAFGATVKAATLNNTNKIVSSTWTGRKLNAQIGLHGLLYWSRVSNATGYQFEVVYLPYNQDVMSFDGDADSLQEDIFEDINRIGRYSVTVRALDSNRDVITEETFYFDYYGSECHMVE